MNRFIGKLPRRAKSLQSYNLSIFVADIRIEATQTVVGGGGMWRKKNRTRSSGAPLTGACVGWQRDSGWLTACGRRGVGVIHSWVQRMRFRKLGMGNVRLFLSLEKG